MRLRLSFLLLALGLAVGCGASRHAAHDPTTLRLVQNEEPTRFDPHRVEDGSTIEVLMHVAEGLVQWTPETKVGPCLAERWDLSPDGCTYTFHLRPGVRFHNGREVTAEDVVWSLNRAATARGSGVASTYLNDILGFAEAQTEGKPLRGVRALNQRTVQITIDRPRPYFLMKLTYPTGFVLAREAVDDAAGEMTERNLIGTGPFKIAEYRQGHQIVLEANPDYWGGAPRLQRIVRRIVGDAATRHAMFESGELDLLTLTMADAEQDRRHPELKSRLHTFERAAVFYFALNQRAYPPFQDRRVRQAFAHAIDRESINREVLLGFTTPAYGIIPKGILGYDPEYRGLSFDPVRARALLAEAGYPGGSSLPTLTLHFTDHYPDARRVCEAAAEMLRQHLGVRVALRSLEWNTFLDHRRNGQLPFYFIRWAADYPDPQNFLSVMLHSRAGQNRIGYRNPAFDRLCDQADTERDPETRERLYRQAERIAVEDAPWIPICFQKDLELWHPRLAGVRASLMGHLPHTETHFLP